jgi:hypothetical protein
MALVMMVKAKAMSLNVAYYSNNRKTKEAHTWLWDFKKQLKPYHAEMQVFMKDFETQGHFLKIYYTYFIPSNDYWNKHGRIKHHTSDWSNFPKIPDDLVFNKWLGVDDSQVQRGTVEKVPWSGTYHLIGLIIDRIDKDEIESRSSSFLRGVFSGDKKTGGLVS